MHGWIRRRTKVVYILSNDLSINKDGVHWYLPIGGGFVIGHAVIGMQEPSLPACTEALLETLSNHTPHSTQKHPSPYHHISPSELRKCTDRRSRLFTVSHKILRDKKEREMSI
jgi:hypothetical protein